MMDLRKTITCWLLALPLFAGGQGLILDDAAYELLPRQPVYHEGSKAENELLATQVKADLRPYCPRPQSQGAIGSCTGWSTGYGALSILNAIQRKWEGKTDTITQNAFSALFVYNQVKTGSCDLGAAIDAAGRLLRDKGDILSAEFDKFKNNCERMPTEEQIRQASKFRIKDFMTLFSVNDNARIKIEKTKLSLAQKRPVIIGMLLRKNFDYLKKDNPVWYPDHGDTTFAGAHAMVVVGYDDGKEAFEVMNSWGTGWGDGGFAWVKYKDYAKYCCYGFQFIPHDDPASNQTYNVKAYIRHPFYDESDHLLFENDDVFFNGKFYELTKGAVKKDHLAQLFLAYATEGAYVYVFSYNPQKQINVHWPRDGNLDNKFEGANESAIITVPDIRLAIPDENGALQLDTRGQEYLCMLFSRAPVADLNKHLKLLRQQTSTDFMRNLYAAFGGELMPAKNIHYDTGIMGFSNTIPSGKIAPIVLRIRVE